MHAFDLFPYVVSETYFRVPGEKHHARNFDRWGIVRRVGHDVYQMLVDAADGSIRNVHVEDLQQLGLDPESGEKLALQNLAQRANDATVFKKQIVTTPSGLSYMIWTGDWLTASCILLPGLGGWAQKHLNSPDVLVSIPQTQFMFLMVLGNAEFRRHIREFIQSVVAGMDKRISDEWFSLSDGELAPFVEEQQT